MQETRLSIIIPHYNSGDWLKHLLSTIPNRKEIQVIVVDDWSTQKLEEYEACKRIYEDGNVEFYVNEKKKSAGGARNTGLKYAKGEWLLFADADDFFFPEFYEKVSAYFESDYDIVYFMPTSIDLLSGEESDRHVSLERFVRNYISAPSIPNKLDLKYSFVVPWSKLVRRSLFEENEIWFDEVMVANDVMASVKLAFCTEKIKATTEKIYCVTKHENSLEMTVTKERYESRLEVYFRKFAFLKENLPKEEYKHLNFKARYRLGVIGINQWGWAYLLKTIFKMLKQGIPIWREYALYKIISDKLKIYL